MIYQKEELHIDINKKIYNIFMKQINLLKPAFSNINKEELKKQKTNIKNIVARTPSKFIEISPIDIIDLFINYDIPVAIETIEAIKKYPKYYIKKDAE